MNSETPTALIVRHVTFEDAGSFATVLTACGFRLAEADAVTDDLRAAGATQAGRTRNASTGSTRVQPPPARLPSSQKFSVRS